MNRRRINPRGTRFQTALGTVGNNVLNRKLPLPRDLIKRSAIKGDRVAMKAALMQKITKSPAAQNTEIAKQVLKTLKALDEKSDIITRSFTIDRSFIGRSVLVTSTPTRIIRSTYARGYTFLNPAKSAGLTTTGTLLGSSAFLAGASGDTQDSANNPSSTGPTGVAAYKTLQLYLDISVISGATVTVNAQTQDPVSSNWATTQSAIFAETTTGTFYANLGSEGIDTNFAISYTVVGGTATMSLGFSLKDGLGGSSAGLNQTVYLGPLDSVNTSMGFPVLEGQSKTFFADDNMELWAVSELAGGVTLKIFELQ